MTQYGTEVTTQIVEKGNTVTVVDVIENIKDYQVYSTQKRVSERVKVYNKKDETTEYLVFSDIIERKRQSGVLVLRDADPSTRPSFVVEYPRNDHDGGYFIIRSHTELVL